MNLTKKDIARFWSKVDKRGGPDACWPWTASRDTKNYGHVSIGGRLCGAHRVSYQLAHGGLDAELHVMHSCDNPPCVNPAHLSQGTMTDNMRDKTAKGRGNPRGHKAITHCPAGHPYSDETTRWEGSGRNHRKCRICDLTRARAKYKTHRREILRRKHEAYYSAKRTPAV